MVVLSESHSCVLVNDSEELRSDCGSSSGCTLFDKLIRMRREKQGCDVFFSVGIDRVRFAAHRLILATASEVFHRNFYGSVQSKDGHAEEHPTEIPDVTPEAFELLLQFCYSSQSRCCVQIPDDVVVHLLYAAEKYDVRILKESCLRYLREITLSNCFIILRQALHYGEATLINRCMHLIHKNSDVVLRSHGLQHCNREELALIIGDDNFAPSSELHLFKELIEYGKQELGRKQIDQSGMNIREVLGELLMLVRFPLMPIEDLLEVARENVLTDDELGELLHYKADNSHRLRSFSASARRRGGELNYRSNDCIRRRAKEDFYCVRRAAATEQVDWMSIGSALFFEASANILFVGFAIYGFSDGKGTLANNDIIVMFGPYGGSVKRAPLKSVYSDDIVVRMFFCEEHHLLASKKYYLCVNLCNVDGRKMRRNIGYVEDSIVETSGGKLVKFTFDAFGGNGFFPELYFRSAPF